jgi:putative flippase GtrA
MFGVIGGVGFITEAVVLTALTRFTEWTPWHARIPSFICAVLLTWALNRKHTFVGREMGHRTLEALSYIAIQTCGAAINLSIFGVCLTLLPALAKAPVLPLGVGAAAGFAFNFAVSNLVLYRRRTQTQAH